MKTAGQYLRQARQNRGLELKTAVKDTKIKREFLAGLEADDFHALPSLTSAIGFLKNYAEYLGLSEREVLAVFRRDFDERKARQKGVWGAEKTAEPVRFAWTPRLTVVAGVVLFALVFIVYLIWQYRSLVSAPYY